MKARLQQPMAAPQSEEPPTPPLPALDGVSPFMIASVPFMASAADVYARQFYRGSRVPFRRYLPVNKQ